MALPIEGQVPGLIALDQDETVEAQATVDDGHLLVTDRRLVVARGTTAALDVRFDGLRRIEFDIEHDRPATLIIVPDSASQRAESLAVDAEQYGDVAQILVIVGTRLREIASRNGP
jgi:hypothetical protein